MFPRNGNRIPTVLAAAGVLVLLGATAIGEHHVVHDSMRPAPPVPVSAAVPISTTCPWVKSKTESVTTRVDQFEARATKAQLSELLYLKGGTANEPYEGYTPAIPSLCLPAISEDDDRIGVHAVGTKVTLLPAPINVGASFDTSLATAYGQVLGSQAKSQGVDFASSTMVNVVRSSDFGRTSEVIGGEDPLLNAALGAAQVSGVQSQGVGSILLHLATYSQADGRATPSKDDSIVSQTALDEVYLAPFEAIVRSSDPAGIMAAYNSINGVPAAADVSFHDDVVGWSAGKSPPFVRSDCLLLPDDQAGETAAGLSQSKCGPNNLPATMVKLPKTTLARLATPLLGAAFRLGLIQHPLQGRPGDVSTAQLAQGRVVALRASEEGTVLLANRGDVLPLSSTDTVALIGTDTYPASQGSLSVAAPAGSIDDHAGLSAVWGKRLDYVAIPPDARVAAGDLPWTQDPSGQNITSTVVASAVAAARRAHTAIVVASVQSSEWWDHSTLALPSTEVQLIDAVAAVNPRTVVVLNTGGAVLTTGWGAKVSGIVWQSYPGEEGGAALASLLTGATNFSGHLPVTWPTSDRAQPAEAGTARLDPPGNPGPVQFSEGVDVGYRWFAETHTPVTYPFGYGLSYSSFRFTSEAAHVGTGDDVTVRGELANPSARSGTDVAQVYLTHQPAAAGAPAISLVGFARVAVKAHSSAAFTIQIPAGDLSTWNQAAGKWTLAAGHYTLSLGDSVDHLPRSSTVALAGISAGLNGITVSPDGT